MLKYMLTISPSTNLLALIQGFRSCNFHKILCECVRNKLKHYPYSLYIRWFASKFWSEEESSNGRKSQNICVFLHRKVGQITNETVAMNLLESGLWIFDCCFVLGGYHFLPNRGVSWKSWGSKNFFIRNRGSQKNQEIIGWLQIFMKISFNEIAPNLMHIFRATRIGGYMFLQHCSSGGGVIKILIIE